MHEGTWIAGKRNGYVRCFSIGSDVHACEYKDDRRTGRGTWYFSSGSRYEGDFLNDSRTGRGTQYWDDGTLYEGDFVDGKRHGHGIFTYSNGDKFEG